ncbi:MAG: MTH938/NDUFAF3 family protein [Patescibacteria group bacterium]|jgi:hypothetical protein
MPHIDSTEFGFIIIDNKKFDQVLIIGDQIEERDYPRLKELFGTSHRLGPWETEKLLSNKPEVIIVGTGQDGKLEIDEDFLAACRAAGVEVVVEKTPEALVVYNRLISEGKHINALFHTTC